MSEYDVDFYDSAFYDEEDQTNERRKHMAKIKRDVKKDTIPNRIAFAKQMVAACTGNANFTGITAVLTAVSAKTTELSNKYDAAQAAQAAAQQTTVEQNTTAGDWNNDMETAFLAIEQVTQGDAAKMLTAQVPVYDPGHGAAVGTLPEPATFNVTEGDLPGTLDGSWDPVRGASGYIVEITTTSDVPASWHQAAIATKSSCTLTGLTTGTTYFVRVRAFGAAGNGPCSAHEQKVAP